MKQNNPQKKLKLSRRSFIKQSSSLAPAALSGLGFNAFAQTQAPSAVPATQRIYVGFAAGGGADLTSRLLAEKLKAQFNNQVIVENKTGAAGKLALDALRGSPPDGSGLLLAPLITPVLAPLMFKNPGYDPAKDMVPVALIGTFDFALAVNADHPAKNIKEFISWLKANPTKANFGTPSPGSLPHFFGVMMGKGVGVDMTHVAYRGGKPMLTDLMGGQLACGIDTEPEMVELHKAGRIRVLATFAQNRSIVFPEVPSIAESGFKDIHGNAWYSVWAPTGTPPALVARLNEAFNRAMGETDVKERFKQWGLVGQPTTPAELEKLRIRDTEKWRPIIAASGFKAD
jgi:tripartite-type tricarboxylate transporter receptor subunit TctC